MKSESGDGEVYTNKLLKKNMQNTKKEYFSQMNLGDLALYGAKTWHHFFSEKWYKERQEDITVKSKHIISVAAKLIKMKFDVHTSGLKD